MYRRQRTVAVNEVGQIEVELSDGDAHVLRVDAQRRLNAVGRLLQPLAVGALQRNGVKQYHHHEVEPPHLVRLPETVDAPHLALLVGVAEHTDRRSLAGDAHHQVLAAVLYNVLAQLGQQSRRPPMFHVRFLVLYTHNINCFFRQNTTYPTSV